VLSIYVLFIRLDITAKSVEWAVHKLAFCTQDVLMGEGKPQRSKKSLFYNLPVFRIRDILIRIRILGSVPMDCGLGSCSLFSMAFKSTINKFLFQSFFCLLLTVVTFTSVFNEKSLKSHKTVKIKVFLLFLLFDERIRIREARKLTDPDSEHCHKFYLHSRLTGTRFLFLMFCLAHG
jgi:hypothetical protein